MELPRTETLGSGQLQQSEARKREEEKRTEQRKKKVKAETTEMSQRHLLTIHSDITHIT